MTEIDKNSTYLLGDKSIDPTDRWRGLPKFQRLSDMPAKDYVLTDGLINAVNVAVTLRKPLLLTGEPGTGKSQLARYVAWEFGLGEPLKFATKSSTASQDLFYIFDAVGRLHGTPSHIEPVAELPVPEDGTPASEQSQVSKKPNASKTAGKNSGSESHATNPVDYMNYQALGLAVLRSRDPKEVKQMLRSDHIHKEATRSVVLIDEIDKAPRDVPNDILDEIENLAFRAPELGGFEVRADPALAPIIIITSNSERALPDAFLRRCIYFDIEAPDRETLAEIVAGRIGDRWKLGSGLLGGLLRLYELAREPDYQLSKRPATSEILDTILLLRERHGLGTDEELALLDQEIYDSVFPEMKMALFKHSEDGDEADAIFDDWRREALAGQKADE